MNALLKYFSCTAIALLLLLPLSPFANSLHQPIPLNKNTTPEKPIVSGEQSSASSSSRQSGSEEGYQAPPATTDQATASENLGKTPTDDAAETGHDQAGSANEHASLQVGNIRDDVRGESLSLPENTENTTFLTGTWTFSRSFVEADGKELRADFVFDQEGRGIASLLDEQGIRYTANARAAVSDGALKIQTTPYTSEQSPKIYPAAFMECRNDDTGAVICAGGDGFTQWGGEQMIQVPAKAVSGMTMPTSPVQKSNNQGNVSQPDPAAHLAENFTELSPGGAELPPAIMAQAQKAKASTESDTLTALVGDWRYSRDLARKSDGESIALEFHFDADGRGYSLIKDGSTPDFKAAAEATSMPNGSIRVKTDAYSNGSGRKYYPTFMECSRKNTPELSCDVSNGWTHINDGLLVSKTSLDNLDRQTRMEELLPVAPEQRATSSSAAKSDTIADMLTDMSASVTPPKTEKQQETLSLPGKDEKMTFLEGKWRCDTGLVNNRDNKPVICDFKFSKNGKGTATIIELSGRKYTASVQAEYKKGILVINTSDYHTQGRKGKFTKQHIRCTEQHGQTFCKGRNGQDNSTWEAIFYRIN